jgi:hypothetical protein
MNIAPGTVTGEACFNQVCSLPWCADERVLAFCLAPSGSPSPTAQAHKCSRAVSTSHGEIKVHILSSRTRCSAYREQERMSLARARRLAGADLER